MATSTAGDGDDGEPRPVEEQRSALLGAVSTPALTASLERLQIQSRSISEQANGSLGRALAVQLEPALRAARIQASIGESLQPVIEQSLSTLRLLEPMFAQIAAQQQQWAQMPVAPLMANAQLQERMSGMLVTPEFTAALQRISEVARVSFEPPDADGIDRMSELIDSGEIDAATLETAEDGVGSDEDMTTAIDEAAEVLRRDRPWMSRKRARQVVIVWVWLMWTAALVAIAVAAPAIIATVAGAAGIPSSKDAAQRAGVEFDKRFPPKNEPAED